MIESNDSSISFEVGSQRSILEGGVSSVEDYPLFLILCGGKCSIGSLVVL